MNRSASLVTRTERQEKEQNRERDDVLNSRFPLGSNGQRGVAWEDNGADTEAGEEAPRRSGGAS